MAVKSLDPLFHFFSPYHPLDLALKHDLGQATNNVAQDTYTKHDQQHGKYFAGIRQVMDLFESDGTKSYDCHVECVEKTPLFNSHETDRSCRYQHQQDYHGNFEMSNRIHRRLVYRAEYLLKP